MKKLLLITAMAGFAFCGCNRSSSSADEADAFSTDSTLIVYYSQTGATKSIVDELQKHLGCEIIAIEAVIPYDGDYTSTVARWKAERDSNVKVKIKPIEINLDDYNTVFLAYPVWGGTYALPMATFLADNSLAGKKVVTFATFGSGGIDSSTRDVAAAQPEAEVIKGYGVRNARVSKASAEITRFLIENGYIAGEIEALPEYSEAVPVTEADIAIFDQACGDYQFPLGTPIKIAARTTAQGTDYRFNVESASPDGSIASSIIYVTTSPDTTPEFTEVVRL